MDVEPDFVDHPGFEQRGRKLPPLITRMSLPGCCLSARTKPPASSRTSSTPLRGAFVSVREKR